MCRIAPHMTASVNISHNYDQRFLFLLCSAVKQSVCTVIRSDKPAQHHMIYMYNYVFFGTLTYVCILQQVAVMANCILHGLVCVRACIYMYARVRACKRTCVHMCVYSVRACNCARVTMYEYVLLHTHTHMPTLSHTHTYTHTHAHTLACTHTHTHTHPQNLYHNIFLSPGRGL